jgi:hypothetical protein
MTDLAQARTLLETNRLAFALVRESRVLATGTRPGVGELLAAVDQLGGECRGASLADKVVGHAVAVVVLQAGITGVATPLASRTAADLLEAHGVELMPTTVIPQILNRRGDGPCPLERLTRSAASPQEALAKLREFLATRAAAVPPG